MQRVVQVVFAAAAVVDAAAVVVAATAAAGKGAPAPFLHSASGVNAQMERMAQELQTLLTRATAIAREKDAAAVRAS